jgi:hypothetical protein
MAQSSRPLAVYLEIGARRVFAGSVDWPGWCRLGRDEASALQALLDSAPRFARAVRSARLGFSAPASASALTVIERLEGNATTDFGAPNVALSGDAEPIGEAELERMQALLRAYWRAFDMVARRASGKALRTGPRGGGRDLDHIIGHLLDSDRAYLGRLAWKLDPDGQGDRRAEVALTRNAILTALVAAARGELPRRGPRGGELWAPRTFVRRVGWHTLDHAWEIEDRIV